MKKALKWIGTALLAEILLIAIYLGFVLPQDDKTEQEMIDEMIELLGDKMMKDYAAGDTKRDAHPKSLGLATGYFTVDSMLDTDLEQGVFVPGKSYPALLRFSNASGTVQSDAKADFRGLGLKLISVEGARFDSMETASQDFVLMSNPTMPLGTVELFHDAVYYSVKYNKLVLLAKMLLNGNMDVLNQLKEGAKHDSSPLDITYWSTTPYALGEGAVKYRLVPTSKRQSELPDPLTENYLSENMAQHLATDSASFDFYVQTFRDSTATPIEDAAVEWDTPFIKIGTLTLAPQQVDTPARRELAEQLYFSPSNALEIHRPLGGLNLARAQIYGALSLLRHKRNQRPLVEGTRAMFDSIQ